MPKFIKTLLILTALGGLTFASLTAVSHALAPDAVTTTLPSQGAAVQIYGADVWGVRGRFAIHTWIATRAVNETTFTIHQIIGWKIRRAGTALDVSQGNPNRYWYRSPPILLHEVVGDAAPSLVNDVRDAISTYPYPDTYTMWPGPNSNSFTQWVALEVPELALVLPFKAIGKTWMQDNHTISTDMTTITDTSMISTMAE
jgi:hypothetical protein